MSEAERPAELHLQQGHDIWYCLADSADLGRALPVQVDNPQYEAIICPSCGRRVQPARIR